MRYTVAIAVALGVSALAACNSSPQEEQADNIEASAENTADMMTENMEMNAENRAEEVRAEGDNAADAVEDGNMN